MNALLGYLTDKLLRRRSLHARRRMQAGAQSARRFQPEGESH